MALFVSAIYPWIPGKVVIPNNVELKRLSQAINNLIKGNGVELV